MRSKTRCFKTRVLGRRLPNGKPQERLRFRDLRSKTLAFKKRIAIVFCDLKASLGARACVQVLCVQKTRRSAFAFLSPLPSDTKLLLTKNYSEIIIFEKLRISRVISGKSLSFPEISRVHFPSRITKNNSRGIIFVIISCQRVSCTPNIELQHGEATKAVLDPLRKAVWPKLVALVQARDIPALHSLLQACQAARLDEVLSHFSERHLIQGRRKYPNPFSWAKTETKN